jgi:hypothetical protein
MTTILKQHSGTELARIAFGDEPRVRSSICNIWNEVLRNADGEGGAGGGEPARTFTQDQVNDIIKIRVGKLNDELKAAKDGLARLAEVEARLAKADEDAKAALDAKELEGKSELEKLKINLDKANKAAAAKEAEWAKKYADAEGATKAEREKFVAHVTRSTLTEALAASGALGTAIGDATLSLLSEAQIERDENAGIKSITVGGKSFEKAADAAKHFLSTKPFYAAPAKGGAGSNPSAVAGPGRAGDVSKTTADDDFSFGFQQAPKN